MGVWRGKVKQLAVFLCSHHPFDGAGRVHRNDSDWIDVKRRAREKRQRKLNNTLIAANAHRTLSVSGIVLSTFLCTNQHS